MIISAKTVAVSHARTRPGGYHSVGPSCGWRHNRARLVTTRAGNAAATRKDIADMPPNPKATATTPAAPATAEAPMPNPKPAIISGKGAA